MGIEAFLNGTNADSAKPETLSLSAAGGAEVRFDAKLDLQDPIVQQRASELLNSMGNGGVSLSDLQAPAAGVRGAGPGRRHEHSSDSWDIGIANLEIEQSRSANVFTWVKPPGGDFTHVGYGELREDREDV